MTITPDRLAEFERLTLDHATGVSRGHDPKAEVSA